MRPYVVFHSDPAEIIAYFDKPDAQPIGGTVPFLGYKDMTKRFMALDTDATPKPFMHVTLSLPKGISASSNLWMRIVKTVINAFRLDPDATPWFAARHRDRDCDHIHVAISLRDFLGRLWAVSLDRIKSDRIHQNLCAMLGLPVPRYFDPDAAPSLTPVTPIRNLTDKNRRRLLQDLKAVFRHAQPETIATLSANLTRQRSGFEVIGVRNGHGVNSLLYVSGNQQIYGGDLGTAWEPRFVKARLAFCRTLRRCRYELQLNRIIEIFRNPEMENSLVRTITASETARAAASQSDPLRPADENRRESRGPLSPHQPFERTRRSARDFGGKTGGIADGTHADFAKFSSTASRDDDSDPRTPDDDRNGSQSRDRTEERIGKQVEQGSGSVEHIPRLTLGDLLGKVCEIAKARQSGWTPEVQTNNKAIKIIFADRSAVIISGLAVEIESEGEDAQMFTNDYHAAYPAPWNDELEELEEEYDGPDM